jgi:hypothetical protein
MWPFRRRPRIQVASVRIAEVSTSAEDYPVLTVGQSRLQESFTALGFHPDSADRFTMASLVPAIDPGLRTIADVEIRVDEVTVGYLRPPALDTAIALLESNNAASLEVPVMLVATPAGPDVRVYHSIA